MEESNPVNEEEKATDERGMLAEYIKALGDRDLNNLRSWLNDGGGGERVEKLSTRGNYNCSVQVVYDGVKRENKLMGGRDTRGLQNGEKDRR